MEEIKLTDLMDMMKVVLERTERIDKRTEKIESETKEHFREIDIKLETKIEPTLQAILENQTEVINQKSKITEVEEKHDKLKDRVDVIEYAVKENQNEIETLKKRA